MVGSIRRHGVVLAVAASLSLSTLGIAHATVPTDDPVEAAAGWLATQLTDGERIVNAEFDFDDAGLTADVVFALAAAGIASGSITGAADWLETQVGGYTGSDLADAEFTGVFAGATAKLILVAEITDRDPRAFGGTDLVAQLLDREQADGRFTDDSSHGDFSNTITQSLAVLALERADGVDPSTEAVDLLAGQACDDGGFPEDLDPETCTSAVDATGYAVQALAAIGDTGAVDAAADWLASVQTADGAFGALGTNANSTGLAAVGLELGGRDDALAAARTYLLGLQAGCDDERPGAILFDAADDGDPVRASAQAIPGLTGVTLGDVDAAGASPSLPALDCPEIDPVDEEAVPEVDDETDTEKEDTDTAEGTDTAEDELPRTGSDGQLLTLLAATLMAVGALLLTTVRRSGRRV